MREEKFSNTIKVGEDTYKVRNFNAFDGACVAKFVVTKIAPVLKSVNIDLEKIAKDDSKDNQNEVMNQILDTVIPVLVGIDDDELKKFMADCLSHVDILLEAGFYPVYKAGVFATSDIEYSPRTCFVLCYHAITPLVKDFFSESSLGLLRAFMPSTNQ